MKAASEGRGAAGEPTQRRDGPQKSPWLWGCLIISRQGRCIVNCLPHKPPGVKLHLRQVCNMMVAVQNLAGPGRSCFLDLSHYSVGLAGRQHFVVAVLAPPAARGRSVELRAEQIAHSFEFYHGRQVVIESHAEEAEAEKRLSSYTVHDVMSSSTRSEGDPEGLHSARSAPLQELETLPSYCEFEQMYLNQALKAPNYSRMWLSSLACIPGVRHAALLAAEPGTRPSDLLSDGGLEYHLAQAGHSSSAQQIPSTAGPGVYSAADVACGPSGGLVWQVALAGCRRLATARAEAKRRMSLSVPHKNLEEEGLPGYLTLTLRHLKPPLMVFIKAVCIPVVRGEAALVVLFQDEGIGPDLPSLSPRNGRLPSAVPLQGRAALRQQLADQARSGTLGSVSSSRGPRSALFSKGYKLAISQRKDGRSRSPATTLRMARAQPVAQEVGSTDPIAELAAEAIMMESIVPAENVGQGKELAPPIPPIIQKALKMAEGLIQGAFPLYDPADAKAAPQSNKQSAAGSMYHRPQPPMVPPHGSFRRSSIGPAASRSPAADMGSRRRPVVPLLPLDQLRQLGGTEDAELDAAERRHLRSSSAAGAGHEPLSAGRVVLEEEGADDHASRVESPGPSWQRPGTHQREQQQRARTPGWAAAKRQDTLPAGRPLVSQADAGDPNNTASFANTAPSTTTISTPRQEPGSNQWYIAAAASPRRNSSIQDGRGSSGIIAGTEEARGPGTARTGSEESGLEHPRLQPRIGSVRRASQSSTRRRLASGQQSSHSRVRQGRDSAQAATRAGPKTAREMRCGRDQDEVETLLPERQMNYNSASKVPEEDEYAKGHSVARRLALFLYEPDDETSSSRYPEISPSLASRPPDGHVISPGWSETATDSDYAPLMDSDSAQETSNLTSKRFAAKSERKKGGGLNEIGQAQNYDMTQDPDPGTTGKGVNTPRTPRGSPIRAAFMYSQALDRELRHAQALLLAPPLFAGDCEAGTPSTKLDDSDDRIDSADRRQSHVQESPSMRKRYSSLKNHP